ncbi:MAG: 3-deoxy-8-phosphooctulonate synthase [Planctomycetia bacterium]|nr:3-deoxy-8-phosphooctulonate synthase [Planctomycetia bacterium]
MPTQKITIHNKVTIGGDERFTLIAGPCAIENEAMILQTAEKLKDVCERLQIPLIFKSSFDKANRSSIYAFRGVGMETGLKILQKVRDQFEIPVVTDVHESVQCEWVAEVADMLQIPAFLCRQTDLLVAAARTMKPVNVKKAQFMAPEDMKNVVTKMTEAGNEQVLLCERGTAFGYHHLVVDMTSLWEMRKYGHPVVFDATHSVQRPGDCGTFTSGNREYVAPLMNAALAIGVDAIFAEVHPCPDKALSDAANQLSLDNIEEILKHAVEIDAVAKGC